MASVCGSPYAQTESLAGQPIEIILYDAETIARINAISASSETAIATEVPIIAEAPKMPETGEAAATPTISEPVVSSIYPRDISSKYNEFVLGIPVITNPVDCGQGELEIRVTVENVKKSKGYIIADLHNHIVADFLEPDKVVLRVRQSAVKGTTELCIPLTQPGDYAIAFYHDQNSDRRFNKGLFGIPKERFAMSTNPKYEKRKPYYDEVDFTVGPDGADIVVKLVRARDLL